jgi:hypothetical protein
MDGMRQAGDHETALIKFEDIRVAILSREWIVE